MSAPCLRLGPCEGIQKGTPFLLDLRVCQIRKDVLDLHREQHSIFPLRVLKGILQDEVSIGIQNKVYNNLNRVKGILTLNFVAFDQFLHYDVQIVCLRSLDAPIDDVGGAFLHAQLVDDPEKLWDDSLARVIVPMLEDLLERIVAIGVLCEFVRIRHYFLQQLVPIVSGLGLLNEHLNHRQTDIVHCQVNNKGLQFFKDELPFVLLQTAEHFLDHMSTLGVL